MANLMRSLTFRPTPPQRHPLSHFPLWFSRWFGYRASTPPKRREYVIWFWSFIGAFCGLAVIMAVFDQAQYFVNKKVPVLVASYGASAVLIYGAIEVPLAQPRALVGGHFIGAFIGVCVSKLFSLLPTQERFDQLRWLSASLSCAITVVLMQITGTTHPPAGATAVLPSVDAEFFDLSWYYLPVVLLSSSLALAVALVINNIQRRYPMFWFYPATPISAKPAPGLGPEDPPSGNGSTGTLNDAAGYNNRDTGSDSTPEQMVEKGRDATDPSWQV